MSKYDMKVRIVAADFADYRYRAPYKFGGRIVDSMTLLNVFLTAELPNGRVATGLGSIPLGTAWGWPSTTLTSEETLKATILQAEKIADLMNDCSLTGHPVEIAYGLENAWLQAGREACLDLGYDEMMPMLNSMVCSSAFDAALHDAYGKVLGRNIYDCYSEEYMHDDLSIYLDDEFTGEYLDQYTLRTPKPALALYHSVGALDPLTPREVQEPAGDGLPDHLGDWIIKERLTHFKIKLNGDDLAWDVDRVMATDRVAESMQRQLGRSAWFYSLDFNEKCGSAEYVLEFLKTLEEKRPAALNHIQYIEQPTSRDLEADPENKMHKVAKIRPVVIDESLVGYDSLRLARERGYTGVALKVCKGQSKALVLGAAAQKFGMFLCVQDLTCFGSSYLHSVGLAARIPSVTAVEGNGRQYLPYSAYKEWADYCPRAYTVVNGLVHPDRLVHEGLGHVLG